MFPLFWPHKHFYRCTEKETCELVWVKTGQWRRLACWTKPVLWFGSPHLQDHYPLIDFLSTSVWFPLRGRSKKGSPVFWWHLIIANIKLLCLWYTSSPFLFTFYCPSLIQTGIQKREAMNCRKIRHFENRFGIETLICGLQWGIPLFLET